VSGELSFLKLYPGYGQSAQPRNLCLQRSRKTPLAVTVAMDMMFTTQWLVHTVEKGGRAAGRANIQTRAEGGGGKKGLLRDLVDLTGC
jgi:hypothetical protein